MALLGGYALAVAAAVRRAERCSRVTLASQEVIAFAVAVGGVSAAVALLAPVELLPGSALDTVLLGLSGVLATLPLVWAGWSGVAALLARWGAGAGAPASDAPPRGRGAEAER